jgi:hypothetical protein
MAVVGHEELDWRQHTAAVGCSAAQKAKRESTRPDLASYRRAVLGPEGIWRRLGAQLGRGMQQLAQQNGRVAWGRESHDDYQTASPKKTEVVCGFPCLL